MSLRACEWRALRRIEAELCRSDPRLRSMFWMFAWLTPSEPASGPEGPGDGRTRRRPGPAALARVPRLASGTLTRIRQAATPTRLQLAFFITVAVAIVTCGVLLGGALGAAKCRPSAAPLPGPDAGTVRHLPADARLAGARLAGPPPPGPAADSGRACSQGGAQPGPPPATQP